MDKNFYNDVLIGSYLSNNAVLLRTKPVVIIRPEIFFNATNVNVNVENCRYVDPSTRSVKITSCVDLRYCLRYDGSYVPSSLLFNITLQMDSKRMGNPRCFAIDNNQIKSQFSKVQELNAYRRRICSEPLIVYLKNKTSIDDIFTPIDFSLTYSLVELKLEPTFCPKCPIIENNPKTTNQVIIDKFFAVLLIKVLEFQLHFQTGCRIDQKCISNLKLSTRTLLNGVPIRRGDQLFQGFHKNLTIVSSVANSGEPSYLTKIVITSHLKLNLLRQDSRCRLLTLIERNDTVSVECNVGNPLLLGASDEVSVPLDISQLDSNVNRLDIRVDVITASEPTKDSDLSESIEIGVMRSAGLEMFGSVLTLVSVLNDH